MELFDLSASMIGVVFCVAILCFVMWNYIVREKTANSFLEVRIRDYNEEQKLKKSNRQKKIEAQLEELDNPMTYEKLMNITYMLMFGVPILTFLVDLLPIGLFIALLSFKFPDAYLRIMRDRQIDKFREQLPTAIEQLLAVIQAGQTPQQGYKAVGEEQPYPIGKEFTKLSNDLKTGASQEDALQALYERFPLPDLRLFQTGMVIAAEASPAVAMDTLRSINYTIRMRESQKKSAKSTIMQGKYTAIVISLLPLAALAGLAVTMPDNLSEFLATDMGKIAYGVAFVLDGIGYAIASKLTSTSNIVKF